MLFNNQDLNKNTREYLYKHLAYMSLPNHFTSRQCECKTTSIPSNDYLKFGSNFTRPMELAETVVNTTNRAIPAFFSYLFLILLFLIPAQNANSTSMQTYSHSPKYLFSVDKSKQSLTILQSKSPLKKLKSFECSTGNNKGDKMVEGDERTPEGIYFLEYKRTEGLNYELYGNVAYVLNYPNPVDKLESNTGYGIWLHGRGKELLPRDTEGCIAIRTVNLHSMQEYITPGETPILIGKDAQTNKNKTELNNTANILVDKIQDWKKSWEKKSRDFFSFYAPQKYSRTSSTSFEGFRDRKQRLFREYEWISIYLDKIRALPASNYWVTYFQEFFRSPEYSNQGIKRLYWQNIKGTWKIVGTEWIPRDKGLPEKYLNSVKENIQQWVRDWKRSWENTDMDRYKSYYSPKAKQGSRRGLQNIIAYKKKVWKQEKPSNIQIRDLQIQYHRQGFEVEFKQQYTGAKNYQDTGIKRLIIRPYKNEYRILRESWQPA